MRSSLVVRSNGLIVWSSSSDHMASKVCADMMAIEVAGTSETKVSSKRNSDRNCEEINVCI